MATNVGFLDASSGSPSYTGQMLRSLLSSFAGVAPTTRALGVRSGVRQGTLPSTAFLSGASNFTWNVAAHGGVIDAESSLTAGPYLYATDGTDTGTITAANATYPRIDILYIQINDNTLDGSGSENGSVNYLAGTAAPSPAAPNPPNSRTLVIANISVPQSGGGNPSVSWVAPVYGAQPACSAYQNSAQSISSGPVINVSLDTNTINNDGMWTSGANNKFTCITPGPYLISGQVSFASATWGTGKFCEAVIQVNGTTIMFNDTISPPSSVTVPLPLSARVYYLNAGDVVTLGAQQNNGSAVSLVAGVGYNWMSVNRLGG